MEIAVCHHRALMCRPAHNIDVIKLGISENDQYFGGSMKINFAIALMSVLLAAPAFAEDKAPAAPAAQSASGAKECPAGGTCHKGGGKHHGHHHHAGGQAQTQEQAK
jgi:hypothetical protein